MENIHDTFNKNYCMKSIKIITVLFLLIYSSLPIFPFYEHEPFQAEENMEETDAFEQLYSNNGLSYAPFNYDRKLKAPILSDGGSAVPILGLPVYDDFIAIFSFIGVYCVYIAIRERRKRKNYKDIM